MNRGERIFKWILLASVWMNLLACADLFFAQHETKEIRKERTKELKELIAKGQLTVENNRMLHLMTDPTTRP